MCGIIGYVGTGDAVRILLDGLRRLEYRGYDSAGLAVIQDGRIEVRRRVGKLVNLEQAVTEDPPRGTTGVGHTRWATHGRPSVRNAHPHRSDGCALVHNGIIENYQALRRGLEAEGYAFESETDTEAVAHLVARELKRRGSLGEAVRAAVGELRGSYALAVLSSREPGTLVAARSGCPLVIGRSGASGFVASDVTAILPYTRDVAFLEEGDIAVLSAEGDAVTGADGRRVSRPTSRIFWDVASAEKGGYPHFMLKEIHEQPQVIRDTLRGRCSLETGDALLAELGTDPRPLAESRAICESRAIWMIACGTSWHAGLAGRFLIESLARLPVYGEIGSEFRYRDPLIGKEETCIAISQSGETADTLAAAREARRKGARVLSIVNVVGSTLARESDGVLYTRCGPEIGVASTKAFTAQLASLALLALALARARGTLDAAAGRDWLEACLALPACIERILDREPEIAAIAARYCRKRSFLYLGRGINYPLALEGALKLKEISYIHAEGCAAGEMKHGPIALIDQETPVVVLAPRDPLYEKTVSNLMEVKARSAPVIAFVTEGDRELARAANAVFPIPEAPALLTPILLAVPLQLLAYHIAVLNGRDVDRPRNLAKSVTVE